MAERCKTVTLCKKCNRRFLPIVNPLPSFLRRTFKNGKNVLFSFSTVNLILGCLEFNYQKNVLFRFIFGNL